MNAAARLKQQSTASQSLSLIFALSRTQMLMATLVIGVVISCLSLIFVTNTTRNLHAKIEQARVEKIRQHVQWGQLLLEKSTLTMQSRVQHTAEQELGMQIPEHKSVVIVNE